MRVTVLGRPAVVGPDQVAELRGARQLGLLAILAVHRGRPVRSDRLADELWDGQVTSDSALRVTLSRLRTRFVDVSGSDPIRGGPSGYTLDLAADECDDGRFEAQAGGAVAAWGRGDVELAQSCADAADSLWVGDAFEGVEDLPSVRPRRVRLEAARLDNLELGAAVRIAQGHVQSALDVVERLVAADPFRERAWGLRMLALYRQGRADQALAAAHELRDLLRTELRTDPGGLIVAVEADIAAGHPPDEVGLQLLRPEPRSGSGRARALPPAAVIAPGEGAFVGRGDAVRDLLEVACGRSSAQVAVVEGPAGMGKSRLAREVAAAAWDEGTAVAWGACTQDEAGDMVPVRSILRDLVTLVADPTDPALGPIGDVLSAGYLADSDTPSGLGADVATRRARLHTAIEHLARMVPGPALVVLDDAQWVHDGARQLVAHLVATAPGLRWLVAVRPTQRTDHCEALLGDLARRVTEWHELPPLEGQDVRELVATQAPLLRSDAWGDLIVQRAGGNPFFVTELLRHLLAGGAMEEPLPRSVEAVVRADLHRLGPEAAALARVAAVAGAPHPLDVLLAASDLDDARAEGAIHALVAAGLLRVDVARIEADLSHDLARDAITAQIDAPSRRRIHRDLAGALPTWGDRVDELRLGHLLAAGPSVEPEALDVAAAAVLGQLNLVGGTEDADRIASTYLEVVGKRTHTSSGVTVLTQIVEAQLEVGRVEEGEALQAEALVGAEALGEPGLIADVLLSRSPYSLFGPAAAAQIDRALGVLDDLPPTEWTRRLRLACWCGHLLMTEGRLAEADRMVSLSEQALGARTHPVLRALVIGLRYSVSMGSDADPEEARQAFGQAVDLAAATGEVAATSTVRVLALDQALRHGSIDDYEAAVVALEDDADQLGRTDSTWFAATSRAGVDLARGDLAASAVSLARAADIGARGGQQASTSVAMLQVFVHLWDRGTLALQRGMFADRPSIDDETALLLGQGLTCLESGDIAGGREVAEVIVTRRREDPAAGYQWSVSLSFGAELAYRTDHAELAQHIATVGRPHTGSGLSAAGFVYLGAADRALGLAAATLGDLDAAIAHLRTACADDRQRGAPPWAARAAATAAEVLRRRGDDGDEAEAESFERLARELRPTI